MVNISSAFTRTWLICCLIFTGTRGVELGFFLTFWGSWLCVQLCPKMEPLSYVLRGKNNHSRTKVIHLSLCQRKADEESKRVKTYFDHWERGLLEAALLSFKIFKSPLVSSLKDHLVSIYPATCLRIFQWWFINLLSLKKRKPIFSSVLAIGRSDFTIFSDESIFFLSIIVPRFHEASLDRGALLLSSPYCTYYYSYTGLNGSVIA